MAKVPNAKNQLKDYMDSRKPVAYFPEGDTFDIPNHSGLLANTDALADLNAMYARLAFANTFTADNTFPNIILDVDTIAEGMQIKSYANLSPKVGFLNGLTLAEMADFGLARTSGHFFSDAVDGDFTIRNLTSGKKILLGFGSGASSIELLPATSSAFGMSIKGTSTAGTLNLIKFIDGSTQIGEVTKILGFFGFSFPTSQGGFFGASNGDMFLLMSSATNTYSANTHSWQLGGLAGTNLGTWNSTALTIETELDHDGSKIGFYGVTTASRPSAYTQTYSTASRTHSNMTSADLTDSTGGTIGTDLQPNGVGDSVIDDNFASVVDQMNKIRADIINVKQVLNSSIDDDQSQGLKQ